MRIEMVRAAGLPSCGVVALVGGLVCVGAASGGPEDGCSGVSELFEEVAIARGDMRPGNGKPCAR